VAVDPPTRPVPPSTRTRDEAGFVVPSLEMVVARDGLGRGIDAPAISDGVLKRKQPSKVALRPRAGVAYQNRKRDDVAENRIGYVGKSVRRNWRRSYLHHCMDL
jgi:hypothetical protein